MKNNILISILILVIADKYIQITHASGGDRSGIFIECFSYCFKVNCTLNHKLTNKQQELNQSITLYDLNQPTYLKLLGWTCNEECKYWCMWETVYFFEQVYGLKTPQFFGKWPFIRVLGMQEPVSAIASVLNLIANLIMFNNLKKKLYQKAPFKWLWYFFSFICMNTWFWSAVFHTKDSPFTERMDYFSAFALILVQFNTFFIRFLKYNPAQKSRVLMYTINLASIVYYLYHINYLSSINFDYGYNMKVNIIIGILNSIFWLMWCYNRYFKKKFKYVWRCAFSVFIFDVLMVFEIFDFSPLFRLIDSHALWHLSTVIIPYFWYNFLIHDSYYVSSEMYQKLF